MNVDTLQRVAFRLRPTWHLYAVGRSRMIQIKITLSNPHCGKMLVGRRHYELKNFSNMVQHILPINDSDTHEESTTCHCQPEIIHENGNMIVVHNSFDGREGVEWANEILKEVTN